MCKLKEDVVKEMISQIKEEINEIKEKNRDLIAKIGVRELLEKLNKDYLGGNGKIIISPDQIYVITYEEYKPLIVDFICLYEYNKFFFISALNGTHIYVAAIFNSRFGGGAAANLLMEHLYSKNLTKQENMTYFNKYVIIETYGLSRDSSEFGIREEKINSKVADRIARLFLETFLRNEALRKSELSGGPSDGD